MLASASLLVLASLAHSAMGLIYAVDSSSLVATSTFSSAKSQGFTKAIIRGYQEACSVVSCNVPKNSFVQTLLTEIA